MKVYRKKESLSFRYPEIIEEGHPCLATIADVHIDTRLIKPLLPGDDGNRVGFPSPMAALYIYYALKFIIDDILDDY